ncbi:MAG: hypothetical protein V9822_01660 [Candidatus Dasytiphilus stammeri]
MSKKILKYLKEKMRTHPISSVMIAGSIGFIIGGICRGKFRR